MNIDIVNIGRIIIKNLQFNIHSYKNEAGYAIKNIDIYLSNDQAKKYIEELNKIRKNDRFLSFAASTALSLFDFKNVDKMITASFFSLHGQLAINLNFAEESLFFSKKSVKLIENNPSDILINSYSQIATASRNLSKFSDAVLNYKKAKEIADFINREDLSAWQIFRLGKMYVNYLHQPSRSLEYLEKAKSIFSKIDSYFGKKGVSSSIDEIGDLYRQHTSNIERAVDFYKKAKEINQEISYHAGIARNIAHLGLCEEIKGNIDAAEELLEESIYLLRNIKHQDRGLAIRLGQLSRILLKKNDIENAEKYINESIIISEYYNDVKSIASHKICLGQLYRKKKDINLQRNISTNLSI
ncbi:tetratricopeptide repeat protein [Candidatus Electronema sp. JM]|uniref:tetratricopeptide repeat protein n=1 Tax=Candidatus Electronema sp. JM TaxID=3401571 RepID=UPI003AA7B041